MPWFSLFHGNRDSIKQNLCQQLIITHVYNNNNNNNNSNNNNNKIIIIIIILKLK